MDFSPVLMGTWMCAGQEMNEHPDYTTGVTGVYPQNTETTWMPTLHMNMFIHGYKYIYIYIYLPSHELIIMRHDSNQP